MGLSCMAPASRCLGGKPAVVCQGNGAGQGSPRGRQILEQRDTRRTDAGQGSPRGWWMPGQGDAGQQILEQKGAGGPVLGRDHPRGWQVSGQGDARGMVPGRDHPGTSRSWSRDMPGGRSRAGITCLLWAEGQGSPGGITGGDHRGGGGGGGRRSEEGPGEGAPLPAQGVAVRGRRIFAGALTKPPARPGSAPRCLPPPRAAPRRPPRQTKEGRRLFIRFLPGDGERVVGAGGQPSRPRPRPAGRRRHGATKGRSRR